MLNRFLNFYQRHAAKRMFSHWSSIYEDEVAENAYSAADEAAAAVIRHLAPGNLNNPSIADIGIGTGLLAQQVYDSLPCRITGLDFSEDMMAACSGRGITELLIKCDVGCDPWPLQDGSQDAVMAAGLMEYMTPDMAAHFFTQSARICTRDGILVFTYVPAGPSDKKVGLWRGHSGTYLTCRYAPEEMEAFVSSQGFALQEHTKPFKGCVFHDGSSYDYRLIAARKK